jgi:hypothetical protein
VFLEGSGFTNGLQERIKFVNRGSTVVIIFSIEKRFGLVEINHSGLEGSKTVAGQEEGSRIFVSFVH